MAHRTGAQTKMALLSYLPTYDMYVAGEGTEVAVGDYCEVIDTHYQTGAVRRTVRDWDGLPSAIGAIRPRAENPENFSGKMVARGYIKPAIY